MNDSSLNAHIGSLEEKHEALKKEIAALESEKIYDDAQMSALKRKKLHLKDEIEKYRTQLGED
ncbi:MAG: DUF465 domain-containing protein [Candidatus Tokpelaia sp.]|uniref:YdcH family protein n=1 Tax=Candidatus Tokpelaia sp. TaxID=2233777 RepID=UPI00123B11EA|nr:YdcH family protein [Candidatus Tokpelaia sp.]KAA6204423.1 MAG: DUF465 domain-containing protein [Candidatus Tokpelaia sp.]KAA6205782.1 MAG: DUF465 domain-containing protein [Candidatus Tokpelaia sp.]KAA6406160.1 DUF465 domain-containing protein [Candidatus Tokpelaia sp.]